MATQVQWRGGTTAEHATFTGAAREVTVDTQKQTLVVHDGSTAGGAPLQKQYPPLGSAAAPTYTFTGDTNTGIYSPGADQVAVATNGTGRLFVDASGDVGVGTASPNLGGWGNAVTLQGVSNAAYEVTDGTVRASLIAAAGSVGIVGTDTDHPFYIRTNNTERLRITSAGLVGIGTSSPSTVLHISSASPTVRISDTSGTPSNLTGQILFQEMGTTSAVGRIGYTGGDAILRVKTDGAQPIAFLTSDAERVRITSGGNVGIGTSSPASTLHVAGTFRNTGQTYLGIGEATTLAYIGDPFTANTRSILFNRASGVTDIVNIQGINVGVALTDIALQAGGGNVGIGTTTVSDKLHVSGIIRAARSTNASQYGTISVETGNVVINAEGGINTTFENGGSEKVRINASGNLMVGTANDQFNGIGAPAALTAFNNGSRFGANFGASTTGSQYAVVFSNPNGQIGGVNLDGTTTSFVASSDYRLKENVVPLTGAANRLNQLQVHRFNFIADPDKTVDGFLAHEAQAVVPECVTGTKDEVDDENNPVYQGIDQSKLVPLLTAALQEAIGEIESLKARLTAAGI
jgi:hypothetical protein